MKSFKYLSLLTLIVSQTAIADDNIRPYILVEATYETAANAIALVSEKLESHGFEIAGRNQGRIRNRGTTGINVTCIINLMIKRRYK